MDISRLAQPTHDRVNEYIKKFDDSDAGLTDQALTRLVAAFPENHDESAVLLKATTINSLYATSIYAIFQVAHHICALNIDSELTQGSLTVVDKIATITLRGKIKRNYSFATKYCSWHRPDIYPIYDSFVAQLLWAYRQRDHFAEFKPAELWWHYHCYKDIIEQFRAYYSLDQFNFKELDKFLWKYSKEVSESPVATIPPTETRP